MNDGLSLCGECSKLDFPKIFAEADAHFTASLPRRFRVTPKPQARTPTSSSLDSPSQDEESFGSGNSNFCEVEYSLKDGDGRHNRTEESGTREVDSESDSVSGEASSHLVGEQPVDEVGDEERNVDEKDDSEGNGADLDWERHEDAEIPDW